MIHTPAARAARARRAKPVAKTRKQIDSVSPTIKAARAELRKRLKAVGDERDALRECIDSFEDLESSCSDAYEALQGAIEALSRHA